MKKIAFFLLILILTLSISACGSDESTVSQTSATLSSSTISEINKPKNIINSSNSKNTSVKSKHTHSYSTKIVSATCKEQGYTLHTCSCGHSYKDNYTTGNHNFKNNVCSYCGIADLNNLYSFLKNWVIENGNVNGDYISYSKAADIYGGYAEENFSLFFWNDSKKLEFCLHSVIDSTYSINFYIYIPEKNNGDYEYISSYYYRDTGEPIYECRGKIQSSTFTSKYPLDCEKFSGDSSKQNDFMEMSRVGICDTLNCLKQFLVKENLGYTLSNIGFEKF